MIVLKPHNLRSSFNMKLWISAIALMMVSLASGQKIGDDVYWVYFTDKHNNGYQTTRPSEFLSQRSIDRRAWQSLGVGLTDEPVTANYLDSLQTMGAELGHVSRWLNGVVLINADDELFNKVLALSFVDTDPWIPELDPLWFPPFPAGDRFEPPLESPPNYQYGIATEQVEQIKTNFLHQEGYTGGGVRVAVIDAGFRDVDSLPSFESMISEGRLLGTRNFINDSSVFRLVNTHGTYVTSIIGADWNENMMGTAPGADYFLCSTEDVHSETRIEELAWVEAAEYMDSLGFDVFNTSLGYSDFDGTEFDHEYSDMDGQTTLISRAASMLASKGIILCNSAGNEGNKEWYYLTAPSDATEIICVGAADSTGLIASFSSRGPSFDGRVKPDLMAMGRGTGIQYINGGLARGSGTSFSSPVMAGSVASLWQAYPEISASKMIEFIRSTGNRFSYPNADYGYGIPNFIKTYWTISNYKQINIPSAMNIYPNPASSMIQISLPGSEQGEFLLSFYDINGRCVAKALHNLPGEVNLPGNLQSGMYILRLDTPAQVYRNRLIIQ